MNVRALYYWSRHVFRYIKSQKETTRCNILKETNETATEKTYYRLLFDYTNQYIYEYNSDTNYF